MIFDKAIRKPRNSGTPTGLSLAEPDAWSLGLDVSSTDAAMKLSAVNACIEILSNSMAKLPVFIMDSQTKKHLAHPLLKLLTERPNEAMVPSVFMKLIESNRLVSGNGYALIVRDRSNARPRELIPLTPSAVQPYLDDYGKLWYVYTDPKSGDRRKLSQFDILHLKAYTKDGVNGISVLARAAETVKSARMAQQYEGKFYSQSARPSGVLTVDVPLDPEAKESIRQEWNKLHSGVDNAFRIAILDYGLEFKPISVSNADAQFVENKAVSVEDIARFFGVPLYKLGAGKQSYASNEQNGIEYVVGTLHPTVTQYEQELTYKLLFDSELSRGLEIRMNMMAELRGDMASRATWYKTMREIGYFSVNDIADLEDTPAVPGGDTRNASLNYVPLDMFRELSEKRNGGNVT